MGKKIIKENIHIIVKPYYLHHHHYDDLIRICNSIVTEINRHVDNVESADVDWDTRVICEFCKMKWEVNENPNDEDWGMYEPVCCQKAQDEWKKNKEDTGE